MLRFILSVALWVLSGVVMGQSIQISGKVIDEHGISLPNTVIVFWPSHIYTTSNINGAFSASVPLSDTIRIKASYVGYSIWQTEFINPTSPIKVKVELSHVADLLDEVVISDDYHEKREKESSLNTSIAGNNFIRRNMAGSLMQSISRLPGVSTLEIGSGQSKPIIRGMAFNRVVVAENGVVHQGQQWGSDHGLEIDQYSAERVEVIKGPASLQYGSDAIAGVVSIEQVKIPEKHHHTGMLSLTGKTNNLSAGSSASFSGRGEKLHYDIRTTYINYADFRVPVDTIDIYNYPVLLHHHRLRNTAGREFDVNISTGIIADKWSNRIYLSNIYNKSGFFANAHGLEPRQVNDSIYDSKDRDILLPYQTSNHFKLQDKHTLEKGNHTIKAEISFQRNIRYEWSTYVSHGYMPPQLPDSLQMDPDLERSFHKNTWTFNLHHTYTIGKHKLSSGLNTELQINSIGGRSFIIPSFTRFSGGIYITDKIQLDDNWIIHGGLRADIGYIKTLPYFDWFPTPVVDNMGDTTWIHLQRAAALNRNFDHLTPMIGVNYNNERFNLKGNIGSSFRMPTAQELAANGVNYHHFSFEKGDSTLRPEVGYQFDLGATLTFPIWAISVSPFVSYFPNYIFLNPTAEHDYLYGAGNQVYQYTESTVFRSGGELHFHIQPIHWLRLGIIGEYTYSEQLSGQKKGYGLPFTPAAEALFSIGIKPHPNHWLNEGYVTLDLVLTAKQDRIVPPEKMTPGHQTINLSSGGKVYLLHRWTEINLQIRNLLNTTYFNHTSYYRLIGVPEPGINAILNITIPLYGEY